MKSIVLFFLITPLAYASGPQNIDQLLQRIQSDRVENRQWMVERREQFLSHKNEMKSKLEAAKRELRSLEQESHRLSGLYEENEKKIVDLESELSIAVGTLGEMGGVVNQVSGDMLAQVQNSLISAQIQGRSEFLSTLSGSRSLPSIEQLERLWFELQRKINETQKVVSFTGEVVRPNGERSIQDITRIGPFALVSNGRYLIFENETNQIVELTRQPPSHYLSTVRSLERAKEGDMVKFALDPSRGALLSMMVDAPNLLERIRQGGMVGAILIALLMIGIGISIERLITLRKEEKKIKSQLHKSLDEFSILDENDADNPVAQLGHAFYRYKDESTDKIEMKMNEIIIKYLPKVERGINSIKIFAAIGPLLGLLGTVTGMIATFQAITLFGTGDPQLMAGGISMALITTVMGLVCAIPLLLLHTFVSSRSKSLVQLLEEQSAGLIATKTEQEVSA